MQRGMVRSKKTVVFKFIASGESPKGNHKKRVYGEENGVVESLRWYFLMMRNRAQDKVVNFSCVFFNTTLLVLLFQL